MFIRIIDLWQGDTYFKYVMKRYDVINYKLDELVNA